MEFFAKPSLIDNNIVMLIFFEKISENAIKNVDHSHLFLKY